MKKLTKKLLGGNHIMKKKIIGVIIMSLLFATLPMTSVNAKSAKMDSFNRDGRVVIITSKKIVYRTKTGSSPESWAKPKTLKITSSTKFYKCKSSNYNKLTYKLKKVSKSKAMKAISNNGSNYVYFKTSGKTAKMVVYGMENFVG